ncbi:hypothetical protein BOSEA31B_12308 [Hyphomicrobiales bacterium]|nr:hypothetical protein BOSEA31B_12308 [Hyphomicrobiales bacterium]CAH1698087.1 hypothetical protein BOSEA1005_11132 [Hyphomicrobiales bacterium]
MVRRLDLDEDGEPEADLFRRHQRDALQDHAGLLELLDSLPARGLREPDAIRELGDGNIRVCLQDSENLPVDGVHSLKLARRSVLYHKIAIKEMNHLFAVDLLLSDRKSFSQSVNGAPLRRCF